MLVVVLILIKVLKCGWYYKMFEGDVVYRGKRRNSKFDVNVYVINELLDKFV